MQNLNKCLLKMEMHSQNWETNLVASKGGGKEKDKLGIWNE